MDELTTEQLGWAKQLSPKRKSTQAQTIAELVKEQLHHFSIDPNHPMGEKLALLVENLYRANIDLHQLWSLTVSSISALDRSDRVAFFNAKRFLCFQLAKLLDTLQNPLRKIYQSVVADQSSRCHKGPYPIFDNVTAIFSATPVITRTATYLYACTEWIDDAFQGKELTHEIYSRLMNPTSVSLANHIVDLEAGSLASEYFAWNFNSGMAAIDGILSHLLGYEDIIISSRNVYGGTFQLLKDWFGKKSNLSISINWFDGYQVDDFAQKLHEVKQSCHSRIAKGRKIYLYIESPCNPHGYVLDVASIAKFAHEQEITVICDTTIGTPFLSPVLKRDDPQERPDFVIHSYTKDLVGIGTTTAGVVIGRNERMFIPKNEQVILEDATGKKVTYQWNNTLFWNVYYIKGAFLDADKAFEVIMGTRTLTMRMVKKCVNTLVLTQVLAAHPDINVNSAALKENHNYLTCERNNYLGLPAPLFTFDFEGRGSPRRLSIDAFRRFFDCLEPVFGLQVSLGLVNTVVLCPALTSHSEMSESELKEAGISLTTVRVSMGDEDVRTLIAHFIKTAAFTLEQDLPGFTAGFLAPEKIDHLYKSIYLDVHQRYIENQSSMADALK